VPLPAAILVDARNVLRSTWPNLGEDEVVEGAAAWARAHGGRAIVVFDGDAPDGRVGARARGDCVLVGTGRREGADAWLTRTAARLARRGRPHWLVTSDRGLRAAAGGAAERVVGGGRLARTLRSGWGR
jgi:predicted RNA-binding protein with PIN domain